MYIYILGGAVELFASTTTPKFSSCCKRSAPRWHLVSFGVFCFFVYFTVVFVCTCFSLFVFVFVLTSPTKQAPSAVLDLTLETFESVAMDPSKHTLVEFFAPWCGHCKSLAPVYEKLGTVFSGESSVNVAKVRFL